MKEKKEMSTDLMTYNFDSKTHSTKIKTGLQAAKQAGKKLGRPKGGKIKGEARVLGLYNQDRFLTYSKIAELAKVSKGTVQKIINKYKSQNDTLDVK